MKKDKRILTVIRKITFASGKYCHFVKLKRPILPRDLPAERPAQGGEAVRPEDAAGGRAALELLRDLAAPLDRRGAAAQPRGGVRPREPPDD